MHYGFGTRDEDEHGDMVMIWLQRDRGQGMMMKGDGIPRPEARPKPLAIGKTMNRRIAMDKTMQMHAERVVSGAEPSSLQALQVPMYLAL